MVVIKRKRGAPRLDNRKLTSEGALEVRLRRLLNGESYRKIGQSVGLSAVAVYFIVAGKNYREPEAQLPDVSPHLRAGQYAAPSALAADR